MRVGVRARPTRLMALGVTAVVVASCGGPALADDRLCGEVARVAEVLAAGPGATDTPTDQHAEVALRWAEGYVHDIAITGSHLLVAADGDLDGRPDPELAAAVRTAGRAGVGGRLVGYVEPLVASFDACEEAGVSMSRVRLRSVVARADAVPEPPAAPAGG